MNSFPS